MILQRDVDYYRNGAAQEFVAYRCNFISKDESSPNLPDLNHLDYCVFSVLTETVAEYRRQKIISFEELRGDSMVESVSGRHQTKHSEVEPPSEF